MSHQIQFHKHLDFEYGKVEQISPMIRRIIANNPSPFTYYGTGTYILGHQEVAVIDPGPANEEHVNALLNALEGERITHIFITHTHNDHSPATPMVQAHFPAPSYGYGPHGAGKIRHGIQIEEGGDMDFKPDHRVTQGQIIEGQGWSVECVYTPGHTSNHMCYQLREEKALFTGDHVMGWSTSVIAPPDGDMTEYMNSLDLLLERDDEIYWPTHGPAITDTKDFVRSFIAHRLHREQQVLDNIREGKTDIGAIVSVIYANHPKTLHPPASLSVYAVILRLISQGRVRCDDANPNLKSKFHD